MRPGWLWPKPNPLALPHGEVAQRTASVPEGGYLLVLKLRHRLVFQVKAICTPTGSPSSHSVISSAHSPVLIRYR